MTLSSYKYLENRFKPVFNVKTGFFDLRVDTCTILPSQDKLRFDDINYPTYPSKQTIQLLAIIALK